MTKSRFTEEDVTGMSADKLVKEIKWRVKEKWCVLFYENNEKLIMMRTYDKEVTPDDLALAGE
jgi:hypothetical protein